MSRSVRKSAIAASRHYTRSLPQCLIVPLASYLVLALPAMSQITREVQLDPSVVPQLDPTVLSLSDAEKEFLHNTITENDEELELKLLDVQRM